MDVSLTNYLISFVLRHVFLYGVPGFVVLSALSISAKAIGLDDVSRLLFPQVLLAPYSIASSVIIGSYVCGSILDQIVRQWFRDWNLYSPTVQKEFRKAILPGLQQPDCTLGKVLESAIPNELSRQELLLEDRKLPRRKFREILESTMYQVDTKYRTQHPDLYDIIIRPLEIAAAFPTNISVAMMFLALVILAIVITVYLAPDLVSANLVNTLRAFNIKTISLASLFPLSLLIFTVLNKRSQDQWGNRVCEVFRLLAEENF